MTDESGQDDPTADTDTDERTDEEETAWKQTLDQLWAMEEDLESEGWEVAAVSCGHTAPTIPGTGSTDRFGFVFVAPGDQAEDFEDVFERADFDEYEVFRKQVGRHLYLIVRVADTDERLAVLLAGGLDYRRMEEIDFTEYVKEEGELYSHVQLLDATPLGSFHHDDPSLFFPDVYDV
jgi:hypothetical protein